MLGTEMREHAAVIHVLIAQANDIRIVSHKMILIG